MNYWRMQLHSSDSEHATRHTFRCLAAGYVGLDFHADVGDLMKVEREAITPSTQRHYHDFAWKMEDGDFVLVVVRNEPFALVRVAGEYNYTTTPSTLGVWFRHFRAIGRDSMAFWDDRRGRSQSADHAPMAGTLQIVNPGTLACDVIEDWCRELNAARRVPNSNGTNAP